MLRRLLSSAFLIPLGLALFVGGAKLGLIHNWSSDQPFNDQWSAEGGAAFRWRLGGAWGFEHYFFPHGEHTPALTRVIATGCSLANADQWDSRLEMLVSVGAHVLSALLIWQFINSVLPGAWRLVAAAFAGLVLAMPSGFENFLWGFQTQFVFLLTFGLAHLLGTLREERLGASWWLAQIAGLFALFSIASGLLSAAIVAGIAGLRLARAPQSRWAWTTLAVNLALAAIGVWLLNRAFFATERTTGISLSLVTALGHLLAWPLPGPWLAALTQAPVIAALWLTRGRWLELPERLLIGVALWPLALAAAFAYGRSTGAGEIAVRYMDPLSVGLITNAIALVFMVARSVGRKKAIGFGALWLCVILAALVRENEPATLARSFTWQLDFHQRQRTAITAYLERNDARELERDTLVRQYIPHFEQTRDLLADPLMRLALPASIAAPLALQRDPERSTPGARFEVTSATENNARVLTLRGGARGAIFVSQPIVDDVRPVWRLRVSGKIGSDGGQLALLDTAGREHPPLDSAFDATGTWKTVNFLRGSGPVRLLARVPAGQELRLTEPLELGRLSWLAPKLAMTWSICLVAGVAAFGCGVWRDRHSARS